MESGNVINFVAFCSLELKKLKIIICYHGPWDDPVSTFPFKGQQLFKMATTYGFELLIHVQIKLTVWLVPDEYKGELSSLLIA